MVADFLQALARYAEAKVQECPGLYMSIRVCSLGIKVLAERANECHAEILTWEAARGCPSLAPGIVERVSDTLCKHLERRA